VSRTPGRPSALLTAPLLATLLLATLLAACGGGEDDDEGVLRVVTTVSPITSIVEGIAGDRVRVDGVVPEGVNSHTFEPAPSIARLLADADLIIINGLSLEEPTLELAESANDDAAILLLGDATVSPEEWVFDFSFPEEAGRPNPHLWTDPILALRYAELVTARLSELDPGNADYFAANLEVFRTRVADLDAAIVEAVATVPEGQRRLLTYHDSWPYFARRYGMTVIGAVQPSDFSEPSARELARLIDQIREEQVPAVFGSEVFESDALETIARESGATYIDDLRDDDLPGGPGDAEHSYLGLMVANMRTMLPALGGDAAALEGIDTSPVFAGETRTRYPQ
jgi:ABC-type Zn uptake system ZnuABC Zn-binding protein ZnuA